MAYWIQEYGQKSGANRADWKMFHCDYTSDLADLPTVTTEGVEQECDITAHELAKQGDQCLCLEDATVWELGYESGWKSLS